jgi:hypothetical protein
MRTRAAVDAIKFTVEASAAGEADRFWFVLSSWLIMTFSQEKRLKGQLPRARSRTWLTWYAASLTGCCVKKFPNSFRYHNVSVVS